MGTKFIAYALCIFCVNYSVLSITINERKQCCDLGTQFAAAGNDCKNFKPELAGPRLANENICLSTVDVCCKKQNRGTQCLQGTADALNGIVCPKEDGDRKDCCESCQAGIDGARAKEPCNGMGLGSPYDDAFNKCCEDFSKISSTTSTSSTTLKQTIPVTSSTVSKTTTSKPLYKPLDFDDSSSVENICDSDVCAQICEPVGDSFKCDCYKGYRLMEDGISCRPEKRVLKKGGRCEVQNPCDHDCIDTGTAIKCACREGYQLADDNRTCQDVDECALNLHDCTSQEDCINEVGTYVCYDPILTNDTLDFEDKCPTGYKYNFDKLVCDDIDECQFDLICLPPKICQNTIGSFECIGNDLPQCPPGFVYKQSIEACADIDECLTGQNDCNKESQFCLNTKGDYTCVDKASKNTCPPGFKKNIVTQLCEDINECEEEDDLCRENETCVNEPGGHTCIPSEKPTKSTTSATTTTKLATPPTTKKINVVCPKGYSFVEEKRVCSDINECQMALHNCGVAERCDNTIGSYHCSRIYGCGTGYTLNSANGLCEDDDECELGTHNCKELGVNFKCRNTLGSYRCEPTRQYYYTSSTTSTTSQKPYPPKVTPEQRESRFPDNSPGVNPYEQNPYYGSTPVDEPLFVSSKAYTVQSTSSTTPKSIDPPYARPNYPNNPGSTNISGTIIPISRFTTSSSTTPSTTTRSTTTPHPTIRYRPTPSDETLPYYSPKLFTTESTTHRYTPVHFVIPERPTSISNYDIISGQLKKCLPGYRINSRGQCEDIDECESEPCGRYDKCINHKGRFECIPPMQCKIGFELSESGDSCVDVNECSRGIHKCLPTQICKNYQGYYTCECPPGHHLNKRTNECEDLDECRMYRPCRLSSSQCVNLKGSFRCDCKSGFQRRGANECDDIDECLQTPELCEHNCVNIWGSYRCSCNPGFTLNKDNRTCTDIDECERFKDKRLCIGNCKNVPGSYVCECPPGYKLGSDGRVCVDIDECQQNVCLSDEVCLNTRGSYKCYRINCPANYMKDIQHKSRCKRINSICDPRDYQCILMPEQYTYQYITLVSDLPLTSGHISLFKIKGPDWYSSRAEFSLKLLDVICPNNIEKVTINHFRKINDQFNSMALHLVRPITGPQEIKLQIEMSLFQGNLIRGNAVVYIIIVVSEYPF